MVIPPNNPAGHHRGRVDKASRWPEQDILLRHDSPSCAGGMMPMLRDFHRYFRLINARMSLFSAGIYSEPVAAGRVA